MRKKLGYLQKREFSLKRKNHEEASQNLFKFYLSFGGGLESSNDEEMGRQQEEEVL